MPNKSHSLPQGQSSDGTPPSRPELSPKPVDKRPIIATIVVLIILLIVFIGLGVFLFLHPPTAAVLRDIFIIVLALETLVVTFIAMLLVVALVYLVLKINDLVQLINRGVTPLLDKANNTATIANETAKTVQSRVTVVSDEVVKPVINVLSTISAAKAIVKTLFKQSGE